MLKIYNTLSRTKEIFKPINPHEVGIYVCGPTVYGMPHLGHAKSYVNFDTVVRYLRYLGYKVKYVQNITDVGHLVGDGDDGDDKIAKQANKENLDAYEVAYKYEVEYFNAMDQLNIARPSISARATGFVMDIIDTVKDIIDRGYGYVTDKGNVYFDVRKYSNYGQLSNRKLSDALSGERIEIASDKRNPEDFALWKAVDPKTLMKWNSPWGVGCPGWHIECTTLGKKLLGTRFDIHGGGIDNIFPHHECELAQADVATGNIPMNYFMHNGLVTVNGTKMGKSLGNFITLPDLFKKFDPMVVRYYILQFHYRSNVDFSEENLRLAEKQYQKLSDIVNLVESKTKEIASELTNKELIEIRNNFVLAMDEDFNTPLAMVEINKLVKLIPDFVAENKALNEVNLLIHDLLKLALGLKFQSRIVKDDIPSAVKNLAESRWQAKLFKDFAKADEIRRQLLDMGYEVLDSKDGYQIKKA